MKLKKIRKVRSQSFSEEGDCFGKEFDAKCQQCRMCHDDTLCMMAMEAKIEDKTLKFDNVPIEKIIKIAPGNSIDDLVDAVMHYSGGVIERGIAYDWTINNIRANGLLLNEDRVVKRAGST